MSLAGFEYREEGVLTTSAVAAHGGMILALAGRWEKDAFYIL